MNELTTAWIKALRSDDYKQTTGKLFGTLDGGDSLFEENVGYCCLGVLCDISKKGDWEGFSYVVQFDEHTDEWDADIDPTVFEQWTGLSEEAKRALIHFNDEDHYNFNAIADAIERYAKGERPPTPSELTEGNY